MKKLTLNQISELKKVISNIEENESCYDNGDYENESYGALGVVNKIKHTNDAYFYYNRGNAKYDLQDYDGAILDYNKSIELNPNDAYFYNNRGNAKNNLKDYYGAILDFNKAIELNPNYEYAYYNRGNAKNKLQDYAGAIADFNKLIELNHNDADAYLGRGIAKNRLGDVDGYNNDMQKYEKLQKIKNLTNMQIKDLQQILDDMHNDPSCDNGRGEWLNYVISVRNTIQEAIDTRDGQIIIDAFADNNDQDFGSLGVVLRDIKPKKATAKATAANTATTPTTPTTTTNTAFIPKRRQAISRVKLNNN